MNPKLLRVCLENREVFLNEEYLNLGPRATRVLLKLVQYQGRITPIQALHACFDTGDSEAGLHRIINRLRGHLGRAAILNYHGRGYKLTLTVQSIPYDLQPIL